MSDAKPIINPPLRVIIDQGGVQRSVFVLDDKIASALLSGLAVKMEIGGYDPTIRPDGGFCISNFEIVPEE